MIYGIGVDEVEVARMARVLERTPTFRRRAFTPEEAAYADAVPALAAERYAVRFAAKEATLKAFGTGLSGAALREIEVVRRDSGQPALVLAGRAHALAEAVGARSWLVTLSHSRQLAHALVAGLSAGPDGRD